MSKFPSHWIGPEEDSLEWLGLMIGNSSWHWATIKGDQPLETWDTQPCCKPDALERYRLEKGGGERLQVYWASVVAQQSDWLTSWPQAQEIQLSDIPINNLYPTLGIDRALALLGAGTCYGWPVLVIDGGTALTLTGADEKGQLVGGAILPGIQLQLDSLGHGTSALPHLKAQQIRGQQTVQPLRWARSTEGAIASGVLWGLIDSLQTYIRDWQKQFPTSRVVLTGGAAARLAKPLEPIVTDASLVFRGLAAVRRSLHPERGGVPSEQQESDGEGA